MKRENRKRLRCRKQIKGRVYDTFEVVVNANNEDAAKREYERQGYTVFSV